MVPYGIFTGELAMSVSAGTAKCAGWDIIISMLETSTCLPASQKFTKLLILSQLFLHSVPAMERGNPDTSSVKWRETDGAEPTCCGKFFWINIDSRICWSHLLGILHVTWFGTQPWVLDLSWHSTAMRLSCTFKKDTTKSTLWILLEVPYKNIVM